MGWIKGVQNYLDEKYLGPNDWVNTDGFIEINNDNDLLNYISNNENVRVLGSGWSWNQKPFKHSHKLIGLRGDYQTKYQVNLDKKLMECGAAMTVTQVQAIIQNNWPNLDINSKGGSFSWNETQTVGGIISTNTHHSFLEQFSTNVAYMHIATFINGKAKIVEVSRNKHSHLFYNIFGSSGRLGIILKIAFILKPVRLYKSHVNITTEPFEKAIMSRLDKMLANSKKHKLNEEPYYFNVFPFIGKYFTVLEIVAERDKRKFDSKEVQWKITKYLKTNKKIHEYVFQLSEYFFMFISNNSSFPKIFENYFKFMLYILNLFRFSIVLEFVQSLFKTGITNSLTTIIPGLLLWVDKFNLDFEKQPKSQLCAVLPVRMTVAPVRSGPFPKVDGTNTYISNHISTDMSIAIDPNNAVTFIKMFFQKYKTLIENEKIKYQYSFTCRYVLKEKCPLSFSYENDVVVFDCWSFVPGFNNFDIIKKALLQTLIYLDLEKNMHVKIQYHEGKFQPELPEKYITNPFKTKQFKTLQEKHDPFQKFN